MNLQEAKYCKRGHLKPEKGMCKICKRERAKKYYNEDPTRQWEATAKYKEGHGTELRIRRKKAYEENREQILEKQRLKYAERGRNGAD